MLYGCATCGKLIEISTINNPCPECGCKLRMPYDEEKDLKKKQEEKKFGSVAKKV
jgi:DNA-directed RNA polymerase subunit RPC12/RpoP